MNDKPRKPAQDFTALVDAVRRVHDECAAAVNRTVNTTLTLRNWVIGFYIVEYELRGTDRAKYGDSVSTICSLGAQAGGQSFVQPLCRIDRD